MFALYGNFESVYNDDEISQTTWNTSMSKKEKSKQD